ncbi:MAG: SpoIIE family protein phosphatase [Desulfuromonadales bacterium]|nr:SpoIIE family protein phosphatase [Desulfuromonadales bacterium]
MPTASVVPRRRGLAFKLSLLILTGTAVIFIAAFGYNHIYSRNQLLKEVEANARNLTLAAVNRIETVLRGAEKAPAYLAQLLGEERYDRPALLKRIEALLRTNPEIFGSTIAFEPYTFDPALRFFAPYLYREGTALKKTYLGGKTYDYFIRDWYQIPRELERPIWSDPYFDEGAGNIIMSTYSVPFYRQRGNRAVVNGIVTADISLEWLVQLISRIAPYRSGYAFLITQSGVFVSHPDKELIMRESIFSLAEAAGDGDLRRVGRAMVGGGEGFVALKSHFAGEKAWLYYAPLPASGWSIGVVFPEKALFADVEKLNRVVLLIGASGFAILFVLIVLISGTITRPLRSLAGQAVEIARGNLDVEMTGVQGRDEVGELSRSFDHMKVALKEYIAHLAETTAAKERYESELKIARTIQMSFLPKRFPPFPEKGEFDIYATLVPAKEVGGDLYDFFLLDDEHLFFSIGDVSGKGVPAALFMAAAKTLMKGTAAANLTLAEVLARVNQELCLENDSMMFVTVFCGLLNIRTGELSYSNAGHLPPLLLRPGHTPEWLPLPEGFFLGIMEEATYQTRSIVLTPGDRLVLYTDGVTEAMNDGKDFYTEERLRRLTREMGKAAPEAMVGEILRAVRAFAGDEPQSDDITLLALAFRG